MFNSLFLELVVNFLYLILVRHGHTMKEIADYIEVHYVSVSRSIKRYENKRQK
jgi:DNA-binding MarR family transcriptional regulator